MEVKRYCYSHATFMRHVSVGKLTYKKLALDDSFHLPPQTSPIQTRPFSTQSERCKLPTVICDSHTSAEAAVTMAASGSAVTSAQCTPSNRLQTPITLPESLVSSAQPYPRWFIHDPTPPLIQTRVKPPRHCLRRVSMSPLSPPSPGLGQRPISQLN